MNGEVAIVHYHGFTIEGRREYPTRGDYERWDFRVTRQNNSLFRHSVRISRTQAVIVGGDDARISKLLRDTGLRRIRGKIDLGRFEEGEDTEYTIRSSSDGTRSSSDGTATLTDEEIQLLILQVLEKIRRWEPNPVRQTLQFFDAHGFCEILGIDHAAYLANAALLLGDEHVAETRHQQKTIENGGLYITTKGVRYLKQLQAQAVPGTEPSVGGERDTQYSMWPTGRFEGDNVKNVCWQCNSCSIRIPTKEEAIRHVRREHQEGVITP